MENNHVIETEFGGLKINPESIAKLRELKAQKDKLDKELKTLSSGIVEEIKQHTNLSTPFGEYNFVVKGGYYGIEFDLERFKEEHPQLFMQYQKTVYTKESFALVSATRKKGE